MKLREYFFQVGGTLSSDAACYIERTADHALFETLERGDYGLVLAPRQSGKSSLMAHAMPRLRAAGWNAGFVDLQSLGGAIDPDIWFRDVIYQIVRSLGLAVDHAAWWAKHSALGVTTRFAAFLEQEVLECLDGRVALFFDEIDAALTTPFSDDFFITLRSLYTGRATNPALRRLSLVLLGVAHPTDFIRGRRRTPFNIGTGIDLADFDRRSLAPFEAVIGTGSAPLLDRILYWTGGQPFLFQEVAAAVHEGAAPRSPEGIDRFVEARYLAGDLERYPHFRFINDFLFDGTVPREGVLARIHNIVAGNTLLAFDDKSPVDQRLKLSGLIRVEGGAPSIRNSIYERVFDGAWLESHQPQRPAMQSVKPNEPITGAVGETRDLVDHVVDVDAGHTQALPVGFVVGGCRIQRVLGAGGFGITYAAEEEATGRSVAIKEYMPASIAARGPGGSVRPLTVSAQDEFAWGFERFRQEARLLTQLSHPNLVRVHRYFEANGTAYIVMEMVDGSLLSTILEKNRVLDESELIEIVLPLLDALEDLHGRGILHRDIKPSSVFIDRDGRPVLIDFGSARYALGRSDREITAIVSEGYAPMEQYAVTGNQGPWTDIYALGGLLYRAAIGDRPPAAPERLRIDPYIPAAKRLIGKFSAHVMAAIDAALAVNEEDRPQSISEFRQMLLGETPVRGSPERVAAQTSASSTLLYPTSPRARTSVPHRAVWVGVAILLGLLLFGLGLYFAPILGR